MASRQVYDTPELRCTILSLLDRPTLAIMLRLEKAVTASVAEVLYKEVSRSLVRKMSRATPRRATYCNAVRILEWSNYTPSHRIEAFFGDNVVSPTLFDADAMYLKIQKLRKKYPGLRTIRYTLPDREEDDGYIIQFEGDKILVHLESRIDFLATADILDGSSSSPFPHTPTHPSMEVRHTFITQYNSYHGVVADGWKRWIYANPKMDARITGIHHHAIYGSQVEEAATFEEIMSFLVLRQAQKCQPLTRFYISCSVTPTQLRQLAFELGPGIRNLHWQMRGQVEFGDLQVAIGIFNTAFPNLESLEIMLPTFRSDGALATMTRTPLSGLTSLRQLVFGRNGMARSRLPSYISGIGGKGCVYLDEDLSPKRMLRLHQSVQAVRAARAA